MKTMAFRRSALAWALGLALLGGPIGGSVAFAQGDTPPTAPQTTQADENNEFPWGLLGLLGLGGLAGLRRQDTPRRIETVDASRRA